jgi:hypothetical protein
MAIASISWEAIAPPGTVTNAVGGI